MLGFAGFDFVVIDTEHGAAAPSSLELENLIRAAYASNITPFVRVNEIQQGMIEKVRDDAPGMCIHPQFIFLVTIDNAVTEIGSFDRPDLNTTGDILVIVVHANGRRRPVGKAAPPVIGHSTVIAEAMLSSLYPLDQEVIWPTVSNPVRRGARNTPVFFVA